ncbi:MAG: ATP-dependent RNA helicase HrpA [Betaproteobacteria bacterium]
MLEHRRLNQPRPEYPEDLPVVAKRGEIAAAIRDNPVVIVCGETGSGKTTQLPKICLELGRGVHGLIGHTQPRRIAARTVATRIAHELKSPLGHAVGYKVRFSDKLSQNTYIKLMTDGILLAETQGDRDLRAYDTLIIDEAHERSLNIDFLLGYLKRLMRRRPDLKIIVTSATIDAERFARHFAPDGRPAPVIEVSGRTFPVEVRYRPQEDEEQDLEDAIVDAVAELAREKADGDILVFLPGEREIRDAAEALRKHHLKGVQNKGAEILPLYARLSFEEQERIFRPHGARRIVLSTNVAETSLTVPGIRYVVDTGLARVNRYSYRNKVEQLQVEKISRASANQRAGRCGRVAAGVAIRLYAEADYEARPQYTDPEILRSSLAHVILRMKALKIGDVEDFPFLEAPTPRMIADGYQLLAELGAVDAQKQLTPVGWQLAKFPIDPRIARMIIAAKQQNCLREVLVIAAALSVQDPRERPFEKSEAADRAHAKFADDQSDFMAYLKLWDYFDESIRHRQSNRKLAQQLAEEFLSQRRLREWRDIHGQLAGLVGELGMHPNEQPASFEQIHRALLAGLLGNIGFKTEEGAHLSGDYLGARGIKFSIFPGSGLRKSKNAHSPKWVMAGELVDTARLYARSVAKIEPEWIEPLAKDLVERHYFDPHWERERAMVVAFERVTLYGITIVPKRRVHYGAIDIKASREIFIRQALVAGEFNTQSKFIQYNQKLIKEVQALEHKARKRDVLVSDEAIYAFYDERIPQHIVNGAGFEQWRREAEQQDAGHLRLTREYLMRHAAEDITEAQFPDAMQAGEIELKLKYRFDPGHPLDGITATVPLALLNKLEPADFDWLVPGMIRDKVAFAFKALPKHWRRHLTPPTEHVTRFLATEGGAQGAFADAVARYATRAAAAPLAKEEAAGIDYPPHLRCNYRVVDESGRELASGRDLAALKAQLGEAAQLTFSAGAKDSASGIEREGIRTWDFGDLPPTITFSRGGRKVTGYPALADEGDRVAIRLFDIQEAAQASMRAGVVRLMRLALKAQMSQLEKGLKGFEQAALQLRGIAGADDLRADLIAAICDRAFIGDDELPRGLKAFEEQVKRARTRLPAVSEAALRLFTAITAEQHQLSLALGAAKGSLSRPANDIRAQNQRLVCKGFFSATPWPQLAQLPRYLKAAQLRLQKYPSNVERDGKHAASIAELWGRYETRLDQQRKAGEVDPRLLEFRWQIEELRVSLYAQELKTPFPVSYKRLDKLWTAMG